MIQSIVLGVTATFMAATNAYRIQLEHESDDLSYESDDLPQGWSMKQYGDDGATQQYYIKEQSDVFTWDRPNGPAQTRCMCGPSTSGHMVCAPLEKEASLKNGKSLTQDGVREWIERLKEKKFSYFVSKKEMPTHNCSLKKEFCPPRTTAYLLPYHWHDSVQVTEQCSELENADAKVLKVMGQSHLGDNGLQYFLKDP